jgi:PAS domain S-box-containing protein
MYHILYVDDEPGLLEIGKRFLERSGQLSVDVITSAPAALTLLASKEYDAIIADYQMPEMNGIELLKTIRTSGKTIPFILFTGKGREEVVIQALNEGADFYLQKGGEPKSQFAELSNKIRYAVMRRSAEESLKQNEAQLRQIIDLVPHMIFANDRDGNFLLTNRALAQSYNKDVTDIVGKPQARFHPDAAELRHMLDDNREVISTGTTKVIPEERFTDATGNHCILQTTKVPFTTIGNSQQAVLGIAIDITKRIQTEDKLRLAYEQLAAAEEKLHAQYDALVAAQAEIISRRQLLEEIAATVPGVIYQFSADSGGGHHGYFINERAGRDIFGLDHQNKDVFPWFAGHVHPGDQRRFMESIDDSLKNATAWNFEGRFVKPSGESIWFLGMGCPGIHGNEQVYSGIMLDITERKRMEEKLRESEERYRRIVETTDEGIFQLDRDFTMVYVNRRMAEMCGCTPEDIVGKNIVSFMAPEDLAGDTARLEERRQGKSGRYERRFMTKDGRIRWVHVSATPLMNPDGTFRGSFAMCSDITDRKTGEMELVRRNEELHAAYGQLTATEEELRENYDELTKGQKRLEESENKYRNVVEDQTEFISRFLPDGTHVFVNDAYCRYFGLKRDEILGHRFRPTIPVEDRELVKRFFASLIPGHPVDTIEHQIIMPDGGIRWQRWSDRAIFDPSGTVTEYQSVGRDITAEKETQAALQESEIRFREQYQNNPLAIFTWQHREGDFVLVDYNRAADLLTGGRAQDYLGTAASVLYATHPEFVSEIMQCFSDRTVISKDLVSEHFLPGRRIHATAAYVPPDLIMVHLDDITEQKEAEEALRESQRTLADAMDLANLVSWECDLRTGVLTFDNRFSTLYGTTPECKGICHMTAEAYIRELVHPEDRGILFEEDKRTRTTPDPHYVSKREYRIIRGDGAIRNIEMCVGVTKDVQGRTTKTHGVNQDITDRKKAEEALHRANRQLSLLSGITRHDILNKITGILGYLKLAEMKSSDPALGEYLGKMESATTEIQSQIESTRIYQDLGTNEPQWIELDTVMPRSQVLATIALHVNVQGVEVFADPMLGKIFSNLLDNSIRHGQRVTEIQVSLQTSGEDLVVVWEDNGIGVGADEKEQIFERGFGKNTGLGLFLVRGILALTGITIQETGEPGKGARFEITVPKRLYRFTGSANPLAGDK